MPNAAVYIRVSQADQASVSVTTQERLCRELCDRNGWTVSDVYVDENVSGAVAPEEREGMTELLADLPTTDYVVSAKLDRLSRRTSHLLELVERLNSSGAKPVTADGFINEHTAGIMVGLFAWLAELERERTRERTMDARAEIYASGRASSTAPYGYLITRRDGGAYLAIDQDAADIVRDIARRIIEGQPVADVVAWLNRHQVPTPRMRAAVLAGRTPRPIRWSARTIHSMMVSPALRGIRTRHPREEVHDADGNPVLTAKGRPSVRQLPPTECYRPDGTVDVIADPILDTATWHAVRDALAVRSKPRVRPAKTDSPLSRVALCGVCGSRMSHTVNTTAKGVRWRNYKCSARRACTTVRATALDQHVDQWFRATFSGLHVYREEIHQGRDVSAELADVDRALSGLTTAIEAAPDSAAVLGGRIAELNHKRNVLVEERDKPREVRRVATGETYADVWARSDGLGRRALLLDTGISVHVAKGRQGVKGFDPSRVSIAIDVDEYADAAEAAEDAAHDAS